MDQWDQQVGFHLEKIEACSEIVGRHAARLMGMPEWPTRAQDAVEQAERVLLRAYMRMSEVRRMMKAKQRVR